MAEHDTDRGCLLDNGRSEAGVRYGALAELFYPVAFRHVGRLGTGIRRMSPPDGSTWPPPR